MKAEDKLDKVLMYIFALTLFIFLIILFKTIWFGFSLFGLKLFLSNLIVFLVTIVLGIFNKKEDNQ